MEDADCRRYVELDPLELGRTEGDKGTVQGETIMEQQDTRQTVSPEEDARIAATPATFVNKVYLTPLASGPKITFAETHRLGGKEEVSPRLAVFLQHADLHALHRLLEATIDASPAPGQGATPSRGSNGHGVPERR